MKLGYIHAIIESSTLGTVLPTLAWKRAGLPVKWTRVLDRSADAMNPHPLPGYVRLDTPGKVLHLEERVLEFTDELPS